MLQFRCSLGRVEWKLGKQFDPDLDSFGTRVDGAYVAADGPELDFIRQHFTGLRMADSETVMWYGEDMKFLYENLRQMTRKKAARAA